MVRSASRKPPLALSAAVAACLTVLGATQQGCSTTQDKAAAHKVEAERFLKAREKRQAKHKHRKEGR